MLPKSYFPRVKECVVKPVEGEVLENAPPAPASASVADTVNYGPLITIVDETGAVLGIMDNPPVPNFEGKGISSIPVIILSCIK
jgi:hypothetical protein